VGLGEGFVVGDVCKVKMQDARFGFRGVTYICGWLVMTRTV
jgi:hypothetical protein